MKTLQKEESQPSTKMNKAKFMKLTYAKLQELTGVHNTNWSGWFNSKNSPKWVTMREMASKLGMPLMEFVEAFEERRILTSKEEIPSITSHPQSSDRAK
ncbi:MAG: hypothetical protein NVS2B14_20440 [Chamaesiphon sp.]